MSFWNMEETMGEHDCRVLTRYRFRIEVVDRPGVLSRVSGVLAEAGANVIAIDIHKPEQDVSVDEITVSAVEGWDRSPLVAALGALPGVTVLEHDRQWHDRDPTVAALTWARIMCHSRPGDQDVELARAIIEVTGASLAWALPVAEAATVPVGRLAVERRQSVIDRVHELPPGVVSDIRPPLWLLAVPDDDVTPRVVGFAGRPIGVHFTATEVDRFVALMQLCRAMSAPQISLQSG